MERKIIKYCSYSNTIRQWPENYLIFHKTHANKCWSIGEHDGAVDKLIAMIGFVKQFEYRTRWELTGEQLAQELQEEYDLRSSQENGHIFDISKTK